MAKVPSPAPNHDHILDLNLGRQPGPDPLVPLEPVSRLGSVFAGTKLVRGRGRVLPNSSEDPETKSGKVRDTGYSFVLWF